MSSSSITIDDIALPVRRPASVAELCTMARDAAASGQGVYPVGGGTTLDVGLPPIKPGLALDTTALNQVIDYPARDMTITVQAGITIAKLQETLAAEGQWLPIDVPNPERSTLGGAIALNLSGPRRFGYGTFRDYVIGISFITDEGDEVKAGGRVVKNVAGYDLMKLQVGAVGTLGVITQVTLKVKPKPQTAVLVRALCSADSLAAVLDRLHSTRTRPVIVEFAANRSTGGVTRAIRVAFEEKSETVEWQVKTLLDELREAPVTDVATERSPEMLVEMGELTRSSSSHVVFRASALPSRLAEFANRAADTDLFQIRSQALNGIVLGHSVAVISLDEFRQYVERLTTTVQESGGNLTVRRCPTAWKKSLPIWGKPGPDRDLMLNVKRTLDPKNVFNPGRLFGDM